VIEVLLGLPGHLRERLAAALESGLLCAPYTAAALRSVLGHGDHMGLLAALADLDRNGIGGQGIALLLRTAERVEARAPRPDLVWTGPEVPGLHARDTRRVYEELLGSAERSAWISTYAFFDGPRAFDVVARRMAARPDLKVILLLNIRRKWGDTTAADPLIREFADRFWASDWPGASRPAVFFYRRALDTDGPGAVLHAKAVVVDESVVFVTSANLTEAALDRNIELGLLVRDRALASSTVSHFQTLIDRGLLVPLPA